MVELVQRRSEVSIYMMRCSVVFLGESNAKKMFRRLSDITEIALSSAFVQFKLVSLTD